MAHNLFLLILGILVLTGLVITLRTGGWPTEIEKTNHIMRAVKSAFGGVLLGVGTILFLFYRTSPNEFWKEWAVINSLTFIFCFAMPIFGLLVIGFFVQYSTWGKTESFLKDRLRNITKPKE